MNTQISIIKQIGVIILSSKLLLKQNMCIGLRYFTFCTLKSSLFTNSFGLPVDILKYRIATSCIIRGSNPGGGRFFAPLQTGPGAHPSSYAMGTVSFSGVKRP